MPPVAANYTTISLQAVTKALATPEGRNRAKPSTLQKTNGGPGSAEKVATMRKRRLALVAPK